MKFVRPVFRQFRFSKFGLLEPRFVLLFDEFGGSRDIEFGDDPGYSLGVTEIKRYFY